MIELTVVAQSSPNCMVELVYNKMTINDHVYFLDEGFFPVS